MKKRFAFVMALLILLLPLTACAGGGGSEDGVIEIGDRFFAAEFNEIQFNHAQYLGREIRYEGNFWASYWPASGKVHYFVTRMLFGCCGDDGFIGFELRLDGFEPFEDDTWVEVTGILEAYEFEGQTFLRLAVTSLVELPERGNEWVRF